MDARPVKVLLIDDDPLAHQVVALDLEELAVARYELTWKSTYDDGFAALITGAFDVALVDRQLGEQSGIDLLRRALDRGCRTPLVMLTGQGERERDVEAMRAGAADYLVKGEFGPPLLERCLRYAVERARVVEALRETQERYALAVAGANDGIWDWNVKADAVYFSPRWKSILGYEDRELDNALDGWLSRAHPEDAARLKTELEVHVNGSAAHLESEHRLLHKDGTYRWVVSRGLAVRGPDGIATRIAGSMRDVTQSRGHDPLTGLPNRLLYLDRLARVMERARRKKDYSFAVLFLDLDRFKIVNDSLGHLAGDELLIEISRRIQSCVRLVDTVARLGGDEFTILLEDVSLPEDATRVADRIQSKLSRPFTLAGREVFSSTSIGIAMGADTYERPDDLLRDADTAMYRAKAGGPARHQVFDSQMHQRAVATLQLESDLRRAVEAKAFSICYQPIVSLAKMEIIALEALVRWPHPERGIIAPDQFIPLAEETGLIVHIDRWMLEQACLQTKKWRDGVAPELAIAVNVSKRDIAAPTFVADVHRALDESGLPAEALTLEITESAIMDDPTVAAATFAQLRPRDIRLVMDDFGTGYSSLSYLHKLPFTSLKIDRSFVARLGEADDTSAIVRAIVTLARALKLTITAEGVETEAQRDRVRELGCDCAQGYLFARPLSAPDTEALLASKQLTRTAK